MKTIVSPPFRATRGIASGVIIGNQSELVPPDQIDPAFRRDFPAYCDGVIRVPDNVVDFGAELVKRRKCDMQCPKCGQTMTGGAPHGEGIRIQYECHRCGVIVAK